MPPHSANFALEHQQRQSPTRTALETLAARQGFERYGFTFLAPGASRAIETWSMDNGDGTYDFREYGVHDANGRLYYIDHVANYPSPEYDDLSKVPTDFLAHGVRIIVADVLT